MNAFMSASLTGTEGGRVRRLKGFVRGAHFEPETHSPAAEAFVRKAGNPDIEERAETLFGQVRRAFSYKRKDIDYSCDTGTATIKTPDFEATLLVGQAPGDARSYEVSTLVGGFTRPDVIDEDRFIEVFRGYCDTVLIELANTFDVEAKIDALEESSRLAGFLDYPADASSLSIKVPRGGVQMELRPHEIRFTLDPGGNLRQLIDGAGRLMTELFTDPK